MNGVRCNHAKPPQPAKGSICPSLPEIPCTSITHWMVRQEMPVHAMSCRRSGTRPAKNVGGFGYCSCKGIRLLAIRSTGRPPLALTFTSPPFNKSIVRHEILYGNSRKVAEILVRVPCNDSSYRTCHR